MSKNDSVMQRMKENYEKRSRISLIRRIPVIMRLDGQAFHTYTSGLDKPFDEGLIEDMANTAKFLCSKIQGAKCAYVQSDEISILITDFDKLTSAAWFDNQVQKMASISASMASAEFNKLRLLRSLNEYNTDFDRLEGVKLWNKLAFFDSRVFNLPRVEVPNYFLARQRDAVKNSISMLAQSLYSSGELLGKNSNQKQEMCFKKGHNWNDLHYTKKRGSWIVKNTYWNGELVSYNTFASTYMSSSHWSDSKSGTPIYTSKNHKTVIDTDVVRRTKWESVETPMKFDYNVFNKWLNL